MFAMLCLHWLNEMVTSIWLAFHFSSSLDSPCLIYGSRTDIHYIICGFAYCTAYFHQSITRINKVFLFTPWQQGYAVYIGLIHWYQSHWLLNLYLIEKNFVNGPLDWIWHCWCIYVQSRNPKSRSMCISICCHNPLLYLVHCNMLSIKTLYKPIKNHD